MNSLEFNKYFLTPVADLSSKERGAHTKIRIALNQLSPHAHALTEGDKTTLREYAAKYPILAVQINGLIQGKGVLAPIPEKCPLNLKASQSGNLGAIREESGE